jgi:hypothetical protein
VRLQPAPEAVSFPGSRDAGQLQSLGPRLRGDERITDCYCAAAGAAAGFAVASAFCGFFFVLSLADFSFADLVSSPAGGLAVSDEDDVGVQ